MTVESCISESDNNTFACKPLQVDVPSAAFRAARRGQARGRGKGGKGGRGERGEGGKSGREQNYYFRCFQEGGSLTLSPLLISIVECWSGQFIEKESLLDPKKKKKRLPIFEKLKIQTWILKRIKILGEK